MGRADGALCFAALQAGRVSAVCRGGFPRIEWLAVDDHRIGILSWQAERACLSIFNLRHATPPIDLHHHGTGRADHSSWRFEFVLQVNSRERHDARNTFMVFTFAGDPDHFGAAWNAFRYHA